MITKEKVLTFIHIALSEDIREGDHSSLACIPKEKTGRLKLIIKEKGIIAGIKLAEWIFNSIDSDIKIQKLIKDGDLVKKGDIAFIVKGSSNKTEIKKAIEMKFDVKVVKVATMNQLGKNKQMTVKSGGRTIRTSGKRADYKKAIITIEDGQTIDMIGGEISS